MLLEHIEPPRQPWSPGGSKGGLMPDGAPGGNCPRGCWAGALAGRRAGRVAGAQPEKARGSRPGVRLQFLSSLLSPARRGGSWTPVLRPSGYAMGWIRQVPPGVPHGSCRTRRPGRNSGGVSRSTSRPRGPLRYPGRLSRDGGGHGPVAPSGMRRHPPRPVEGSLRPWTAPRGAALRRNRSPCTRRLPRGEEWPGCSAFIPRCQAAGGVTRSGDCSPALEHCFRHENDALPCWENVPTNNLADED